MDKTDLAPILRRVVLQLGKQPETLLSRKKKIITNCGKCYEGNQQGAETEYDGRSYPT